MEKGTLSFSPHGGIPHEVAPNTSTAVDLRALRYPAQQSWRDLYLTCEKRMAISSAILSFDQKIIHTPTMQSFQIEARRRRYAQAVDLFESLSPASCQHVAPHGHVQEELKEMKMRLLAALRSSQDQLRVPGITYDSVRPLEGDRLRYGYIEGLRKVFNDNLRAVVVYGSAVFSQEPGDYDNFLVVDDLAKAYRDAEGFHLSHGGIPVHVNLIPFDLSTLIFEIASIPSVCSSWWRVLDGELLIPTLSRELVYLQGRARALDMVERRQALIHSRQNALATSLSTQPIDVSISIFKAISQLPAVMVEWTRSFGEDPMSRPRTKRSIINDLSEEGFQIPSYPREGPTPSAIAAELKKGLILASAVLQRAGHLSTPPTER
jgi:hypothetical protein